MKFIACLVLVAFIFVIYVIAQGDNHKTIWKNKFAQSISLAMKTADLGIKDGVIGGKRLAFIKE